MIKRYEFNRIMNDTGKLKVAESIPEAQKFQSIILPALEQWIIHMWRVFASKFLQ